MIWVEDEGKFKYDPALNPYEEWETIYMTQEELFPLKKYLFGQLTITGPANPHSYLDRVYQDWNTYASISNHTNSLVGKFFLTNEDRQPALPLGPLTDQLP